MVEISDRVKRLALEGGWIGVDLDGTMFTYYEWVGWNVFGEPIKPMIERIQAWVEAKIQVRIVTARIGLPWAKTENGMLLYSSKLMHHCKVTGNAFSDAMMMRAIQDHCVSHGLPRLEVQPHKDVNMIELWDDRAIQVVANTGRTLAEEHAAELAALQGKAQGPADGPTIFDQYDSECIPGN